MDFSCRRTLPLHPCSVEQMQYGTFPDKACYAIGMYELNENTGTRAGKVNIYRTPLSNKTSDFAKSTNVNVMSEEDELCHSETFDSGVLDMKFNDNLLACALSTSQLSIIQYKANEGSESIEVSNKYISPPKDEEDDGLFLSVDWANQRVTENLNVQDQMLAVSTQKGSVRIYDVNSNSNSIQVEEIQSIHNLHQICGENVPCWIVTYDTHKRGNVILTGGDDCLFKLWDLRCIDKGIYELNDEYVTPRPLAISKYHSAGVTSAQFHPVYEHIFATGSYDQHICVWDDRNLKSPIVSEDTGGGLWRVKWVHHSMNHPSTLIANNCYNKNNLGDALDGTSSITDFLFLSCMHNGSQAYSFGHCINSDTVGSANVHAHDPYDCNANHRLQRIGHHSPKLSDAQLNENAKTNTKLLADHLAYGIAPISMHMDCSKQYFFKIATCSFYDDNAYEWSMCC